ncbi:MAG: cupin domain-containing protein [Candidatus Omnitrophica bacterium]|nr:cupin domain-containing protein [Candidatus Omnitrophota bacterium]
MTPPPAARPAGPVGRRADAPPWRKSSRDWRGAAGGGVSPSRRPLVGSSLGRARRSHRVIPAWAARLRSREILLSSGGAMAWHSTREREELLVCLAGCAVLEWRRGPGAATPVRVRLRAGQTAFVGAGIRHRVVNAGAGPLRYLYVTG